MALGPYTPCPCGSGKQFKWCCGPIYSGIERALEQEGRQQHETALRLIDEVIAAHPDKPEAWGQKARLLFLHDKVDEGEEALQKAFELNPNYPFGLLLRSQLRFGEGEIAGALLLARRAAQAYAPEAHDYLFEVYSILFEAEMKMHRPLAARAALRLAQRFNPAHQAVRETFESLFGPQGRFPAVVRKEHPLLAPATIKPERRQVWDQALRSATSSRLGDLSQTFDQLVREDEREPAGWFNLGLSRAWLGDNAAAVEAFLRFLELPVSDEQATTAGALTEVLRTGEGMDEQSDYVEWSFGFPLRADPQPLLDQLNEWRQAGQLLIPETETEGTFFALILESAAAGLITVGRPASDTARLAAYVLVTQGGVRVWSFNKEALETVRESLRARLHFGLGEATLRRSPAAFHDAVAEALIFPTGSGSQLTTEIVLEHVQQFYEETWIHKPRRSLSGNTPREAASQVVPRRKLLGVIQFLQDCSVRTNVAGYDWDRLRKVLGLLAEGAPGAAPRPGAAAVGDITALGEKELAELTDEALSPEQLEQAYQTAQKLNAQELSARFARALIARPPLPEKKDRYPWYSFLLQKALGEGDTQTALDLVNEGERDDCEHNEGLRRNDYELRRGQVHVKRGEAEQAHDVFQRLIERTPDNLKVRGTAAEAMLSLKAAERALKFAEEGVAKARQQNDRDSERYLLELVGAAKKQLG